jgi:hypothetical protein
MQQGRLQMGCTKDFDIHEESLPRKCSRAEMKVTLSFEGQEARVAALLQMPPEVVHGAKGQHDNHTEVGDVRAKETSVVRLELEYTLPLASLAIASWPSPNPWNLPGCYIAEQKDGSGIQCAKQQPQRISQII